MYCGLKATQRSTSRSGLKFLLPIRYEHAVIDPGSVRHICGEHNHLLR